MSTDDCNNSRKVTRCRWVVEAINRVWRTYRYFGKRLDNHSIKNTDKLTRIVCALINMSKNGIFKESEHHFKVSQTLNEKCASSNVNTLYEEIVEKGLHLKWTRVDADTAYPDFPRLSLEDIQDNITCGPFAVNVAKRYIQEHFGTGLFTVLEHNVHKNIIRVQIQSRYCSGSKHNCWIEYTPTLSQDIHRHDNIVRYYCKCKAGARTAGCCSHVASVLCYLSYYRYHKDEMSKDDCIFSHVQDAKKDIRKELISKPSSRTTIEVVDTDSSDDDNDELEQFAFHPPEDYTEEETEYTYAERDELLDFIDF